MSRAQSLVELAICAPVLLLLAVGAASVVQVAEAQAGLDAATRAAAMAAARAPDATAAHDAAIARFDSLIAAYRVRNPSASIVLGSFDRGTDARVASTAWVDVGWAALVLTRRNMQLRAAAAARVEPWRTRR